MITNQDIINLEGGLQGVKNLSGIKFAYVVSKNINKVKSEIDSFRESVKPSDAFNEYEKKRAELCELHARKDDKGKSIIKNGEYDIDNRQAFDAQLKVLQEDNKDVLDARQKQIEDFNAFLREESKVEPHKIDVNDVPKDITAGQMSGIELIVTGELK